MILRVPPSPRLAPGATDALADGEALLAAGVVVQAVATSNALASATNGPRHPPVRCSAAPIQSSFYWYGQLARPPQIRSHKLLAPAPKGSDRSPRRGSGGRRGAGGAARRVSGCTEW